MNWSKTQCYIEITLGETLSSRSRYFSKIIVFSFQTFQAYQGIFWDEGELFKKFNCSDPNLRSKSSKQL